MSEPKFYAVEEKERLTATDIEDAIAEYLEDIDPTDAPAIVMVQGYEPRSMQNYSFDMFLEHILEGLDDEYGDPDGQYTEATEGMKAAAEVFKQAIIKDFYVWMCEKTGEPIKCAFDYDYDKGALLSVVVL